MPLLLVVLVAIWLPETASYDQHDEYKYIMHYYESNSEYPIVHVYYNHHFAKSRQFEDFLNIVEET